MSTLSVDDAKAVMGRIEADPVFFAREILGGDLWDLQVEIIEAIRDYPRVAVKACSSSGKSFDASVVVLWFLLTFRPSTVISTAPTLRQVKDILWREIHARYHSSRVPIGGTLLTTELEFDEATKWFALGLTTKEKERFQGFHNTHVLVVADEASGIPEEIFDAIENPLSSGFTRFLMIGNPTQPEGSFKEAFDDPDRYHLITISAFDTPNFTHFGITLDDIIADTWREKIDEPLPRPYLIGPEWVADRWKKWGPDSSLWTCYVMGNFPTEALNTLIPLAWIDRAIKQELEAVGGVVFGVDTARFGDDETAVEARQGPKVIHHIAWQGMDTTATIERIEQLSALFYPARLNIDNAPIGAGVIDGLRKIGYPVVPVDAAGMPKKRETFVNIRAEMFWNLRTLFQDGEIDIPDDPVLQHQLSTLRYEMFKSDSRLYIESKRDMRARGLGSPDRADALALAFYEYEGAASAGGSRRRQKRY